MKTNIIALFFLSTLLLSSVSCKKFLDVNKDPNNAVDVTVNVLLPSAQSGLTFAVGNTLSIDGGIWGQYWTQSPNSSQYKTLDQYAPSEGDFGNVWRTLQVDALENFQKVIDKGNATNQKQYVAIAMLLKAYTFQLTTDLWGDVPFSQATQGDATVQILNPKYDAQSDIYNGLVALIDDATKLINDTDAAPAGDDLIYGGDMGKWLRFANTLKLRIGLRLAKKDPSRAATIVKSLQGADFVQPGESALQTFNSTGGQQNPLYGALAGTVLSKTPNLVASSTAVNFYTGNSDPRLNAFYANAGTGATVVGIPQGSYSNPPTTTVSSPAAATGANATDANSALAPVKLITDYESDFLQAEAVARGWLTGGNAGTLYNKGIIDNFAAYGVSGDSAYFQQPAIAYPNSSTIEVNIKAIITQKWAAMNGNQTIEAWTEWRRTGYPSFFIISKSSIIGAGRFPGIFLYPSSELTRNPNAPKTNHLVYDKVWWAN
jgi:hypothetical protein